ncbi:MAG: tripartite tricarboxylate transporter substrate binding protein [Betaproteobacteria bacterium]|nr:tripartite tricarboxylate transporter substrate binding protein [Betaproteobacteria bacterium]
MTIKWALLLLAALVSVTAANAQPYPSRPIRMIVPFPAGGASDTSARIVAQKLSETLKQQVVVENRPGAGGTIGAGLAAKASADGHTLLMGSSTEMVTSPHIYGKVAYDTVRDFAPVTHVASQPLLLVVHPSVPAKSVADLVALGKARPRELNCASSGNGSTLHLAQVLFENATGARFLHVPFGGSPQAAVATLSGEAQLTFGTVPTVAEHVRSGRLRGLGLTSLKRSAAYPGMPTVSESGVPGYEMLIWNALFVPRGTPPAIITRLHAETVRALAAPDVREAFTRLGAEVSGSTPEQLRTYVASEWAKLAKVVAAAGVRID